MSNNQIYILGVQKEYMWFVNGKPIDARSVYTLFAMFYLLIYLSIFYT